MAKAITFTNYSNEDFSHTWDGVRWDFPKGKSTMLAEDLARHFAKHLAMRELVKKNKNASLTRAEVEAEAQNALNVDECIVSDDDTKLESETMNYNNMRKADLVKEAEAKGIDIAGKNKSELVDDLESFEGK